ncbi:MAG: ABC transporter permease [Actinomycetota bacterium]|nr:ABC transporter permease [Actinomycetota bacterium]
MLKFLGRRFVNYVILVFIATSLTFVLASLTFHPENRYNQRNPPVPQSTINQILNDANANPNTPLVQRYGHWLKGVVQGDFGQKLGSTDTVTSEIGRRVGVSLRLLLIGTVIGTVVGVGVGVVGAVRQRKPFDAGSTAASYVVLASPIVVLILLTQTVAVWINNKSGSIVFPTALEYNSNLSGLHFWSDRLQRLVLPTFVLSITSIAFFSRYQRSAMLDVLGSDFLRTARAKGLTRRQALMKHGVRTALIPMVTFFAYSFGLLITGAIFTEKLFAWHGMGEYLIDSINSRDTNAVCAVTSFTAVLVLLSGMLSDIIYAALDPRVRSR